MDHDDRGNADDDDNLWDNPHEEKDGDLIQLMEAEKNLLIRERWEPSTTDDPALDKSIANWTSSREFKDYLRANRLSKTLYSLMHRLDNWRKIDDRAFWKPPIDKRPIFPPPIKEQCETATRHLGWIVVDCLKANLDAVKLATFGWHRDVCVCLRALLNAANPVNQKCLRLERNGHYEQSIKLMKRMLKTERWTLRAKLEWLAASTELTAEKIRNDALPSYFQDGQIAHDDEPSNADKKAHELALLSTIQEIIRDRSDMPQRQINEAIKSKGLRGIRSSRLTQNLDILRDRGLYNGPARTRKGGKNKVVSRVTGGNN